MQVVEGGLIQQIGGGEEFKLNLKQLIQPDQLILYDQKDQKIHLKLGRCNLQEDFPRGSVVNNPPVNAGDMALIPGSERSPGEGMATHSSILAWEIPQTEEPGRLQSMGSQNVREDLVTQ